MKENEVKTWSEIRATYPDEWVLLQLKRKEDFSRKSGKVLLHGKDYLELCYKSSEVKKEPFTTILFTGDPKPPIRKWVRLTVLKGPEKKS